MMVECAAVVVATQRTEVGLMHSYYQTLGYRAADARRAELLATIQDRRHPGHKLATDDLREGAKAETAQARLLADAGLASGWRLAISGTRRRLGAALVEIGARLQGTAPRGHAAAAPAGNGTTS